MNRRDLVSVGADVDIFSRYGRYLYCLDNLWQDAVLEEEVADLIGGKYHFDASFEKL